MVFNQIAKCRQYQLTRVVASEEQLSRSLKMHWEEDTCLVLAMVAIEMPVEPTVPSKMRELVWGCRSPCRSASSITVHTKQVSIIANTPDAVETYSAEQHDP